MKIKIDLGVTANTITYKIPASLMRKTQTWKNWDSSRKGTFSEHLMKKYPFIIYCHYVSSRYDDNDENSGFVVKLNDIDKDQLTWMLLSL